MADVVHPKKLDRTRPFGSCLGAITDGVHFLQGGYGFNAQGACVKVYPEAPDYKARISGQFPMPDEEEGEDAGEAGQAEPGTPETDADPANPNVTNPNQRQAFSGMTWGGPEESPPVTDTPAPPDAGDEPAPADGPVDTDGPIDPEMDWNQLQAVMKDRGLPRPKNKADALAILQAAGATA